MSDIKQYGSYFVFDDLNSSDFYVWISGAGTFDAPAHSFELVQIPGRSGDLILNNNRFENIEMTYPCFISKAFPNRFAEFRAALMSKAGEYHILTDTYHPDEFRMAAITGGVQANTGPYNAAGKFDLTFTCKPQRYLLSGFTSETFLSSGTITNPTLYASKPLLRVYGAGSATINGITLIIDSHGYPYTDIDCEAMSCFYTTQSLNQYVSFDGYEYPTLDPGENTITLTSVSKIDITPRWWTI